MNFTGLFIRRPVMTTLVMLGILAFGIMAYRELPVNDLPVVDYPVINVRASLPGASPETMASSVATPLEREFSAIAGLDSMTSSSSLGNTSISLQFDLSRDIDSAAQDVQAAISRAQRDLPDNMPSPPSFSKVNPADSPVLYIAMTSPTMPLYNLDEYAETLMAQRISTVSGVAQVRVYGAQKYAVRIKLNPDALATKGIALDTVVKAIQDANVNLPTGDIQGPTKAYTIQATGQLKDAAAYRQIVVAYQNQQAVRLGQLGTVVDSVEDDKTAAWYNNQRALVLAVQRQPGTNTVAVVDRVRKLLPSFRGQLPASVSLHILYDRSQSIRASVQDVKFTLLVSLALVIMVIFLFLRNLRSTLIPSFALPMAIIGTFAVMYMLGYTLDNLSLMALTLAVGFVVDDAIVMLENIVRHIEMGKPVMKAAFEGASEVGFTIVSMTLALVAVFIPMLFMAGMLGRLFREFAVTIAVAILVSGFVSLTLTPMLCSRFLKPEGKIHHGRIYRWTEKGFDGLLWLYEVGLRWVLRHRLTTMVFSAGILVATYFLYTLIPLGFLPSEDNGQIFTVTQAAEDISFEGMAAHQQAVAKIVAANPYVDSFMSLAGGTYSGKNGGMIFIKLKPRDQRPHVDKIIQQLMPEVAKVPGINVFMQNPPPIRVSGRSSRSQYQFTLQSSDTKALYHYTPLLTQKISQLPGFVGVTNDLEIKNPELNVEINRDKASTLGVSAQQIEDALYSAYGSRQISTIYTTNNTYEVILELEPQYQNDPKALSRLYVHAASGTLVPLSTLATITHSLGPLSVNHQGQLPATTISFNLAPGTSLGDATVAVDQLAREMLPQTISASFQGNAQVFQDSMASLGMLLILAVLVIYLVLGILYESFIHPLTIFSALPFAAFGALLTLWVFHTELNIYSFVGIILLIGLVKKNGIMMIDFAIVAQQKEGKSAEEAIYEACRIRFRPIMMTTVAALMGTLPIAVGIGAGAESRQPLGLAVVGGLLFSQLVTLYVTPVFYLYMESFREWAGRHLGAGEHGHHEALPSEPVQQANRPHEESSAAYPNRPVHAEA